MTTTRDKQKSERRRAILDAAAAEFATRGYAGTTFASIADRMGLPRSAVGYHHFPSKEALADAVMDELWHRWAELPRVQRRSSSGLEHLLSILLVVVFEINSNDFAAATARLLSEDYERVRLPSWVRSGRAAGELILEEALLSGEIRTGTSQELLNEFLLTALGTMSLTRSILIDEPAEYILLRGWTSALASAGHRNPRHRVDLAREGALRILEELRVASMGPTGDRGFMKGNRPGLSS